MKRYSLRRRLIATVLLLECALVAGLTGATLFYLWRDQLHAFDLMIRGRADSLLGAVRDAEDPGDNIEIRPDALDLHPRDLWMVEDGRGRVLAASRAWTAEAISPFGKEEKAHSLRLKGTRYRGLSLHGVRQIDAEGTNPGYARPVTIYYAAALHPVYQTLGRAARFLALASTLLVLFTGFALTWLLRRGLAPLEELSAAAAEITPIRPRFRAPASARNAAEVAVLATALESATQRLEHAFRQQQVFVDDAAHELKTAVTIVKSSLQLLSSRPRTTREYAAGLGACLDDCARMEELVQRMLQLARFEREAANPEASCNIAEVARDVAAQMETLAEIRRVGLSLQAPEAAWVLLSGDAAGSLLANLLLNAVQHTPTGGGVTAEVAAGSQVQIEIRDSGSGIPPEDLPHIFERFWRGDRSRTRSTGGTGLGLSICKAVVDSCGGEIRIDSRLGEGTTVRVRLPLIDRGAHSLAARATESVLP